MIILDEYETVNDALVLLEESLLRGETPLRREQIRTIKEAYEMMGLTPRRALLKNSPESRAIAQVIPDTYSIARRNKIWIDDIVKALNANELRLTDVQDCVSQRVPSKEEDSAMEYLLSHMDESLLDTGETIVTWDAQALETLLRQGEAQFWHDIHDVAQYIPDTLSVAKQKQAKKLLFDTLRQNKETAQLIRPYNKGFIILETPETEAVVQTQLENGGFFKSISPSRRYSAWTDAFEIYSQLGLDPRRFSATMSAIKRASTRNDPLFGKIGYKDGWRLHVSVEPEDLYEGVCLVSGRTTAVKHPRRISDSDSAPKPSGFKLGDVVKYE